MKPCKISIIVAVYNTSQYLEQCMEQLTHQTLDAEEYEIIVVNDGSTDGSAEIVRRYQEQYGNITLIDKQNEGTFWCRYDGICRAQGEYIGFVDSDDQVERNMYEILYLAAVREQADIVECHLASGQEAEAGLIELQPGAYTPKAILQLFAARKLSAALWRRIYRRELAEQIADKFRRTDREELRGIRNEDEFLFPLLLTRAHQYFVIPEELYHYRIDSSGSIMGEIQKDYSKKLFHVGTVLKAGRVLLQDAQAQRQQYQVCFWRMQLENLFYAVGVMKAGKCCDKIAEYDSYRQEHRCRGPVRKELTLRDYLRKLHLDSTWMLCKIQAKKGKQHDAKH